MRLSILLPTIMVCLPATIATCTPDALIYYKDNFIIKTQYRDCEWSACTKDVQRLGTEDEQGRMLAMQTSVENQHASCRKQMTNGLGILGLLGRNQTFWHSKFGKCCEEFGEECERFQDFRKNSVKNLWCRHSVAYHCPLSWPRFGQCKKVYEN